MLKWPVSPSLARQNNRLMGGLRPGLDLALKSGAAGGGVVETVIKCALYFSDEFVFAHLGILGFDFFEYLLDSRPVKFASAIHFVNAAPQAPHIGAENAHTFPWDIFVLT